MPELYDQILSDRCYAVRLTLSLLGIACARHTVDYVPSRIPPSTEVLSHNPAGEIPVYVEGELILTEPVAILCHLANTRDATGNWLPRDARFGLVLQWLAFAAHELRSVSEARSVTLFGAAGDRDALVAAARAALRVIEDHLTDQGAHGADWLVGTTPTLADIAAFPAVALSHDCGIGHEDYPALNLWQRRVRKLPGFVGMPGIPDFF